MREREGKGREREGKGGKGREREGKRKRGERGRGRNRDCLFFSKFTVRCATERLDVLIEDPVAMKGGEREGEREGGEEFNQGEYNNNNNSNNNNSNNNNQKRKMRTIRVSLEGNKTPKLHPFSWPS